MGAAASFDTGLESADGENRYYCHQCQRLIALTNFTGGIVCPYCQSTFLEEITSGRLRTPRGQSHNHSSALTVHRDNNVRSQPLTADQARRINNATAMLRLLEMQLREELEHLQLAFENASIRFQTQHSHDKKKLTKIQTMKATF